MAKQLRVVRGLAPKWYVPIEFREQEEEEAPRFHLHPLTQSQLLEVRDDFNAETKQLTARCYRAALRMGLRAWERIYDENGQPLDFSAEAMNDLPMATQAELANEIIDMSLNNQEQIKN